MRLGPGHGVDRRCPASPDSRLPRRLPRWRYPDGLLTGVLTAVVALAGILLGWFLNAQSEARRRAWQKEDEENRWQREHTPDLFRWQRSARLEAYVAFSEAIDRAVNDLSALADHDGDMSAAEEKRRDMVNRVFPGLASATGRVALVAPQPIGDLSFDVETQAARVLFHVRPGQGFTEGTEAGDQWAHLLRELGNWQAAVRGDLAGDPVANAKDRPRPAT